MALPTIVASPSVTGPWSAAGTTSAGNSLMAISLPFPTVASGDVVVVALFAGGQSVTVNGEFIAASISGLGATWSNYPAPSRVSQTNDVLTLLWVGQGASGNGNVTVKMSGGHGGHDVKLQGYVVHGVSSRVTAYDGYYASVGPGQVILSVALSNASNILPSEMGVPGGSSYPSPSAWTAQTPWQYAPPDNTGFGDFTCYTTAYAIPSGDDFAYYDLTGDQTYGIKDSGVILGQAKVDQAATGSTVALAASGQALNNRTDASISATGALPMTASMSGQAVPIMTTGTMPVRVGLRGAVATLPIVATSPVKAGLSSVEYQFGSALLPYPVSDAGSQVLDFSYVPAPGIPWPFPWEGDGLANSLWLSFTAADTQTLTVALNSTFAAGIEVWTGDPGEDLTELSVLGYGRVTLDVAVAPGQRILMRAHPLDAAETGTATLTWSVAARPETGVLGLVSQDQVLETPGWLQVSLLSATPDSPVTFTLDADTTPAATITSDDDGTLEDVVELPALTVGDHTVTATDASGQTQTATFTVALAVQPDDPVPVSTAPTTAPSLEPVTRWVIEDPMPGGLGVYKFPTNPSEMSSPWLERQLRPERPVHASGQDIVWEGRPDLVVWTVKGTVLTQEFYDRLTAHQALSRRQWVIDHHQRAWAVSFDELTFEKKSTPSVWSYAYTAKFLIVGGPVALA